MHFLRVALKTAMMSLCITIPAKALEAPPIDPDNKPVQSAENDTANRQNVTYMSKKTMLRAWHYPPASPALTTKDGAPAVVMAHGLSMTKSSGLAPYAERFSQEGMHVLVFDYRGFGESDGMPRDVVSVRKQIDDYKASVDYARKMPGVDPARIVLWGTSYSGGTVIEVAVRDSEIAAVISQCPNLDNLATAFYQFRLVPLTHSLWISWATLADFMSGLLRFKPYYIKAVGKPGERAAYISEESAIQVARIAGPDWNNRIANRDFMRLPPFRPLKHIDDLPCKILLLVSERDDLLPPETQLKAARKAKDKVELLKYPVNHFGIYIDNPLKDALQKQTEFLVRELKIKSSLN